MSTMSSASMRSIYPGAYRAIARLNGSGHFKVTLNILPESSQGSLKTQLSITCSHCGENALTPIDEASLRHENFSNELLAWAGSGHGISCAYVFEDGSTSTACC